MQHPLPEGTVMQDLFSARSRYTRMLNSLSASSAVDDELRSQLEQAIAAIDRKMGTFKTAQETEVPDRALQAT